MPVVRTEKTQCESCGEWVPVDETESKNYSGYRETVTISVCEDCAKPMGEF